MKSVVKFLAQRWLVTLAACLLLDLLIWLLGPIIAIAGVVPLDGIWTRVAVMSVVILGWLASFAWRLYRSHSNERKMVAGIIGDADTGQAEIATLRKRFEDASKWLKASAGKKAGPRYLYEIPWYILIGPPGAGKTTALTRSGVRFVNSEGRSAAPVGGVGGTRNCEWWFAEDAVLIDTAGRYVSQDSNETADQTAWLGFVDLLKRFRPRQAINGAIVAISLVDLAASSDAARMEHAKTIKRRLAELRTRLGIQFPVYVIFTKLDRIAGFVEFFDGLSREEREQVWGLTFPFAGSLDAEVPIAEFATKYDELLARLSDLQLDRLQQEHDHDRRSLIFGFPAEVAGLRGIAEDLIDEVFLPSRFEPMPALRGVYFTSGVQEGTPIDRVMGTLARSFGIGEARIGTLVSTGRSFFLTNVLNQVVFAEANLVSTDSALENRLRWTQRAAYGLVTFGLLLAAAVWTSSTIYNLALVKRTTAAAGDYSNSVAPFADKPQLDADLQPIRPALDQIRAISVLDKDGAPVAGSFGLYQGHKLASGGRITYRRALNALMLPRLVVRAGQQVDLAMGSPDTLRNALKVYLMLGGQGPFDAALIREWFDADWANLYPDPDGTALRQDLDTHLVALLASPLSEIQLDGARVDGARRVLAQMPLARQAYEIIKEGPLTQGLPEWRLIDHIGATGDRVFARSSGKPLTDGIPGFYTYEGFQKAFLPALTNVVRTLGSEQWVTGGASQELGPGQIRALESQVDQLYEQDFIQKWDRVLGDVTVVPLRGGDAAAQVLGALSATPSPLTTFLSSVVQETQLTRPPSTASAAGLASVQAATSQVSQIVNALAPPGPLKGSAVQDHYKALAQFVGTPGSPAPIDDLIRNLGSVYLQLNRLAAPGQDMIHGQASGDSAAALQNLQAGAAQLPQPVAALVGSMGHSASAATVGKTREQIRANWQSSVLPFCQQALSQRYPIERNSPVDVTLDDFTRLFAPNGMIDGFFTNNLKPFIDNSGQTWKWQQVDGAELGLSNSVLVQFQRASRIRDGFFPPGGAQPALRFAITPVSLDSGTSQALLEIDGQSIPYSHGPPTPSIINWPPPNGLGNIRLAFLGDSGGNTASLSARGPWAWFRLVDQGTMGSSDTTDRMQLSFAAGGHAITYDIQASSVLNPLTLRDVSEFRCPQL